MSKLRGHLASARLSSQHLIRMDRDWGSKPGSAGVASAQQSNVDRRSRLAALALETVDLNKDPYFMKNHLGSYECKLCLTIHIGEGSYLTHAQGKRHQENIARRAAREKQQAQAQAVTAAAVAAKKTTEFKKTVKIGTPAYKVAKQFDSTTGQRSLLFQIPYPEIAAGTQPRIRIVSAFEQKVEQPDRNYQYVLVAAEPYNTVAFKVPNQPIDKSFGKFFTDWNAAKNVFTLQLYFRKESPAEHASEGAEMNN